MANAKTGKVVDEELKKRDCLKCGEQFTSEWNANRICNHCKSLAVWRNGHTQKAQAAKHKR